MSPEPGGPGPGSVGSDGRGSIPGGYRLWIVDGNNVMGARPDGWWKNRRAAAQRLVDQVAGMERPSDVEVVLVFDGSGPDGTGPPGTEVVHAGSGISADDAIVALVRTAADRATIVFTSDAELGRRLRAAGAEVSGARSFLQLLERRIEPGGGCGSGPASGF